jgi:hypothetical protein
MRPLLVVLLTCAVAFTLLCGSTFADLPPFDYEKAKSLSAEKRQQYDVVFFNEMETWNLNSNRYKDSFVERKVEFEQMAEEGYLPAYAALRLVKIGTSYTQHDPEALEMLQTAAKQGDASAMCALVVIPLEESLLQGRNRSEISEGMMIRAAEMGQGACMGWYGTTLLYGTTPGIAQDRKAAMPLLLESARQGYYKPAWALFSFRNLKALQNNFDFTDHAELERAMCWGRLAEQHTNWADFSDGFLHLLRDYAEKNDRPDLIEQSYRFDAQRIPVTIQAVKPEDCIQLEQGNQWR